MNSFIKQLTTFELLWCLFLMGLMGVGTQLINEVLPVTEKLLVLDFSIGFIIFIAGFKFVVDRF